MVLLPVIILQMKRTLLLIRKTLAALLATHPNFMITKANVDGATLGEHEPSAFWKFVFDSELTSCPGRAPDLIGKASFVDINSIEVRGHKFSLHGLTLVDDSSNTRIRAKWLLLESCNPMPIGVWFNNGPDESHLSATCYNLEGRNLAELLIASGLAQASPGPEGRMYRDLSNHHKVRLGGLARKKMKRSRTVVDGSG